MLKVLLTDTRESSVGTVLGTEALRTWGCITGTHLKSQEPQQASCNSSAGGEGTEIGRSLWPGSYPNQIYDIRDPWKTECQIIRSWLKKISDPHKHNRHSFLHKHIVPCTHEHTWMNYEWMNDDIFCLETSLLLLTCVPELLVGSQPSSEKLLCAVGSRDTN